MRNSCDERHFPNQKDKFVNRLLLCKMPHCFNVYLSNTSTILFAKIIIIFHKDTNTTHVEFNLCNLMSIRAMFEE